MMLRERWRSTVGGDTAHCIMCHSESASVFISDGWSVPYASLRLHRLSLRTGEELASVRTRHQGVGALAVTDSHLFAATDSRLFELEIETLTIAREWNRNLVRYTQQLVPAGDRLIAANWLKQEIGVFDPATGQTKRVRAGLQPLLLRCGATVKVISGFDGRMCSLDVDLARLSDCEDTSPVWKVAAGEEIWAVVAGPPTGGEGDPPVWSRRGTERLIKLNDRRWSARLPGDCWALTCDDSRGVLWCLLGRPARQRPGEETLVAVSQSDGRIVGAYAPPNGSYFAHVDTVGGLVVATVPQPVLKGNLVIDATSSVIGLDLPTP